jgi:hypothetical protein
MTVASETQIKPRSKPKLTLKIAHLFSLQQSYISKASLIRSLIDNP